MADIIEGAGAQPANLEKSLAELEADDNGTSGAGSSINTDNNEGNNESATGAEGGQGPKENNGEEKKGEDDKGEDEGDEGKNPGDEGDGNVDPLEFYKQVDALHGFELKVEYPDGVDPLSPEGLHIRDRALIAHAQTEFDEYLRETDPRAYAYMLHRQAGGTDEEWAATPSISLPSYDTFKNSVDLQKQVLLKDLVAKGNSEDDAKMIVEKAVTDQKLFERSEAAYKAREAAEARALENAERAAIAAREQEAAAVQSIVGGIEDIVMNSKVSNIVIPDAKRAPFAEYLKQNLHFDGENFYLSKALTKETLAEEIQAAYFGFVKGDLKEVVARAVKTEATKGLRLRVQSTKQGPKAGEGSKGAGGYVPLGDL